MGQGLVTAVGIATAWYFLGPYHKPPADPCEKPALVVDREPTRELHCLEETSPRCGCDYRLWGDAEFLLFWTRRDSTPPLLTTGTPPAPIGILGQPGTQVLLGGGVDFGTATGGRFSAGTWIGDGDAIGVEGTYLFLGKQTASTTITSNQYPNLARPFYDVVSGMQTSAGVSEPGVSTGGFAFSETSQVWGAEANGVLGLFRHSRFRTDAIVGFRYLTLEERLTATQLAVIDSNNPNPSLAGNRTTITDQFSTQNQFYGGQIGLRGEWTMGSCFVAVRGKIGFGRNEQEIVVTGSRDVSSPTTGSFVVPVGQLALPSNIGRFTHSDYSVVPEVGITAGCRVTDQVGITVGYNFLGMTQVIRPGNQIDLRTDPTQIPRPGQPIVPSVLGQPTIPFATSDYWIQGVTFGIRGEW